MNGSSHHEQMGQLRQRVRELEAENAELKARLSLAGEYLILEVRSMSPDMSITGVEIMGVEFGVGA